MTSPDDFKNLEQHVTRALRAHGDSVEPSPNAYARLARAVEQAPARSRRIRGLLSPLRRAEGLIAVSGDSLRPLAFLAAVLAVAGLGGYSLFSLSSSPADTATAAPVTADVSDLVPRGDGSGTDDESSIEADRPNDAEADASDSRMADSTDVSPRSSVPSDSAATGTASAAASNPVERYAGLTYAPVRISRLEAAEAFLDLLGIDDVELEERSDRVIVRPNATSAPVDAGSVLTTLTIGSIGDGFMVVEARSDRLGLSIAGISTTDPTADDVVDDTVVTAPIELAGSTSDGAAELTIALRSAIDGSVLARTSTSADAAGNGTEYRSSLAVTGAERAWAVVTATSPAAGVRSLAAQPVLYTGRPDPASYTVVGLPPDDPDGGLVLRSSPDGRPIGIIELGSTGVRRLPVPPRIVDDVVWWAVADAVGREGWAASRYLAVDEAPAETTMVELARKVIAAVEGETSSVEGIGLSRPVFAGSIIDPRPISGLADVTALLATGRRLPTGGVGGPGAVAEFYGFDRWADAEVFVPKGYREEGAAEGARAFFGDLPSVVIRSRNPETGGWQRVHLFVSRDGDRPTLVGMVLEHEPLPDPSAVSDESGTPPPANSDG